MNSDPPAHQRGGLVSSDMLDMIGRPGPPVVAHAPIGRDDLRRFVQGVMEDDAIHWSEDAAQSRGFECVVAPPLYPLHAFRRPDGTPDPLAVLFENPEWDGAGGADLALWGGLPAPSTSLKRILNGGVRASFYRLAQLGDIITRQSTYTDFDEREGRSGQMLMVTVETDFTVQTGELLLRVSNTVVMR